MKGSCETLVLKEANSRNQMSRLTIGCLFPLTKDVPMGRHLKLIKKRMIAQRQYESVYYIPLEQDDAIQEIKMLAQVVAAKTHVEAMSLYK